MDVLYSFPEGAAERLALLFSRPKRLPSIWVSKVSGSGSQARSRLRGAREGRLPVSQQPPSGIPRSILMLRSISNSVSALVSAVPIYGR
jgi:hypothetical protein